MDPADPLAEALNALPPDEARRRLSEFVTRELATFLLFDAPEDVDPTMPFLDLGMDSLRAVDFKTLLETALSHPLRTTLLFDFPTVDALVAHLANDVLELGRPGAAAPEAGDGPPAPEPPGALEDLPPEALRALLQRRSARLAAIEAAHREPMAIVGLGCRFPGGARTAEAFWELLAGGVDAIREVPPERWDVDAFHDPDPATPGRMVAREGGFLDGIDRFDAAFFGISPVEARHLDPQQRLLLEVAWEAFESAGQDPSALRDQSVGVFVGTRGCEYYEGRRARTPLNAHRYYPTGNALSTAAGRLSYVFGLRGPCLAIDTACSSALVALHVAFQSLRNGECSAALVGGVNLLLDPFPSLSISKANMLAPDGRCKAFDARADGYVRAEGVGLLFLKPLSKARDDGDRILALIRGTAMNQDGASGGLTVPNGPSQEALLRLALANGGLRPEDVDYVEAHGTGTALGDPIEIGALDAVFGPGRDAGRPLRVGSVKTNIGHLESAAGVAGVIKVIQALRHEALPPLLHLREPNPHVPWDRSVVSLTRTLEPWPRAQRPRRAGVSSFGFSGTNAHVLLEEAPVEEGAPANAADPRPRALLPLSAADGAALRELAERYADLLGDADARTAADVARSAATGRAALPWRTTASGADGPALAAALRARVAEAAERTPTRPPRVGFLFTGQGSQWAGMGRDLHETEPVFRDAFRRCATALDPHLDVPLEELVFGDDAARLARTRNTQPALFALEWSLAALWESWGVVPDRVIGHSIGEYAAAVRADRLDFEHAAALVAARGRLMDERCPTGAMLAVGAAADRLMPWLRGLEAEVGVAAVNAREATVVSGSHEGIAALAARLAEAGLPARSLEVSHGFHSPLMEPMLEEFRRVAAGAAPREGPGRCPMISCLDPDAATPPALDADYWTRHVRAPVRWSDGLGALVRSGCDLLLEVGPHPVLLGLARASDAAASIPGVPSLRRGRPAHETLHEALDVLFRAGAPVDWRGFHRPFPGRRVELPTYPFQRRRHWLEPVLDPAALPGNDPGALPHALLGPSRDVAALGPDATLFEGLLDVERPAWVTDHRVFDRPVLPGAAFLEMGLAAARDGGRAALEGVAIEVPLALADGPVHIQTAVRTEPDGVRHFEIHSRPAASPDAPWSRHARGRLASPAGVAGAPPLAEALAACPEVADVDELYEGYRDRGLDYGPAFRLIGTLHRGPGRAVVRLRPPGEPDETAAPYALDPARLDACFQAVAAALDEADDGKTWLPVGVDRLDVAAPGGTIAAARIDLRTAGAGARARTLDLVLYDDAGTPLARVEGLQLVPAARAALESGAADPRLHTVAFEPTSAPDTDRVTGPVLLIHAAEDPVAPEVLRTLRARGVTVQAPRADGAALPDSEDGAGTFAEVVVLAPTPASPDDADGPARSAATERFVRAMASAASAALAAEVPPRLGIVTVGAESLGGEARPPAMIAAAARGFLGALLAEHPELRSRQIDLDPAEGGAVGEALLRALAIDDDETRTAWRAGVRHVARLRRHRDRHRGRIRREVPPRGPFTLRTPRYGVLEDLEWRPLELRPCDAGEVAVRLEASALNFKDVLHALGMLREHSEARGITEAAEQPYGFEGVGVVTAVGPGVDHVAPGDRVVVGGEGTLASHVVARAEAVAPCPPNLTRAEAAAIQTVFLTALHALEDRARLRPGESVLVHAGAGGVGQAAIQIAQRAGCTVLATASRGKWSVIEAQGVARVMDSRRPDFADAVLEATGGRGVDVVLNSLTGAFIPESLRALAGGGRFVEIGKIGIWSPERMAEARPDVRYETFDLGELTTADPALYRDLLGRALSGLAAGSLRPLPVRAFDHAAVVDAFTFLAQARNVGKVVITVPPPQDETPPRVRADRSYVVTGGRGALGRHVAEALVAAGARSLVLVGRSPVPDPRPDWIERLAEAGCTVATPSLDVADPGAVRDLVAHLRRAGPPLGGVVHAAGVLDDATVSHLDPERIAAVLRPKVAGAWNLHETTRTLDLDWFVTFSSMVSVLPAAGQAVYAAANAVLDALAERRRHEGLPGTSIAWGPWSGGGMASRVADRNRARFAEMGLESLDPDEGARLFLGLLDADVPVVAVLPVRWSRWLRAWSGRELPLLAVHARAGAAPAREASRLPDLSRLPRDEAAARLATFVEEQLGRVLGFTGEGTVQGDARFGDLGVDSLLAVDLRNRLEKALDLPLPATLLFDHPTLDALVEYLLARILPAASGPAETGATPPGDDLESQSETELADRLRASLDELTRGAGP